MRFLSILKSTLKNKLLGVLKLGMSNTTSILESISKTVFVEWWQKSIDLR